MIIFTLPFPLTKFYNTIPPLDYTKLTGYSQSGFWLYLVGIVTLFSLYIWAVYLTAPPNTQTGHAPNGDKAESSSGSGSLSPAKTLAKEVEIDGRSKMPVRVRPAAGGRFVFLTSATFAAILIFSYPLTAIDLFIYAIRTRGWALFNLQPLSTPPQALPAADPWLGLAGEWVDAASPYGPVWEWLSLGTFSLSSGDFLGHLFALKIIGALAYLGCIWLVYKILKQLRPDWAMAGTLTFAWSPLALFESVQNAHNDIVMVFSLLAAIWVFVQIDKQTEPPPFEGGSRRGVGLKSLLLALAVCLLLALSVLVKFVTIIVVPFFLLALAMRQPTWLRRLAWLVVYSSITLILVVAPVLPLWPGRENWAVLKAASGAGRSLLALLVLGLRDSLGTNSAFDLSRNLILVIFALIYLYFLWKTFNNLHKISQSPPAPTLCVPRFASPSPHLLISPSILLPVSAAFFILFWYVLLVAPVFHAWYLLWFLPLASLLLPQKGPIVAAIVFSMTALLIIPYFETIRVWYPVLLRNHFLGHLVGVPLLVLPPALVLLWSIRPVAGSEV